MARITSLARSEAEIDDHRQRRVGGTELIQHIKATGIAKLQIQEHEVEILVRLQGLTGGGRTVGAHHLHMLAHAFDDGLQSRQDQRVIIDQQNLHAHPSAPRVQSFMSDRMIEPRRGASHSPRWVIPTLPC